LAAVYSTNPKRRRKEMLQFPSDGWIKVLCQELNRSKTYAQAAKKWEGDFYFIIEPEGGMKEPAIFYVDLWHGKCREAKIVADEGEKQPAFRMSAPLSAWRKVIEKKLDPIQGLLTRQLQLKGNMTMIMRNVKAAQELVNCCTLVPTQFPA
jgi:putative sterol carrier protein